MYLIHYHRPHHYDPANEHRGRRFERFSVKIPASRYADEDDDGRKVSHGIFMSGRGAGGLNHSLEERVGTGELEIPKAKKSLPTATVTVLVKGFQRVRGIPLDLLGRGTHLYRILRLNPEVRCDWWPSLLFKCFLLNN